MDLGKHTRQLIVEMAKKLCKLTVAPCDILLTQMSAHQFIHGGYCVNGNMIYFEEISMGSIMIYSIGLEQTTVTRFTGRKVARPAPPSLN